MSVTYALAPSAATEAARSLLDDTTVAQMRETLGATTVGANLFTLSDPSAIRFIRINADNTVDALTDSDFRTAIGAGGVSDGTYADIIVSGGGTTLTLNPSVVTSAARALLDDTSSAAQLATLGGTTVGTGLFTLSNPGAVRYLRINADNTVSVLSDADFRTAIGAGTSSFDGTYASLSGIPSTFTPASHGSSHQSGGGDAIKLDDLATPDDNTDLDVSTARHGLVPKAPNDTTKFLNGNGSWAVPSGGPSAATMHPTNVYASLVTSTAGYLNFPSDGVAIYRDTGSALIPWGPIFPLTALVDSGFSWDNQGSSSISVALGRTLFTIPGSATANLRSYLKSKTAPWTITMAFLPCFQAAATAGAAGGRGGLTFSDGTKFHTFWFEFNSTTHGSGLVVSSFKWTNNTTFSASYVSRCYAVRGPLVWLQICDDNTNRICKISADGQNWITVHSVTRTDFLTATKAGLSLDDGNSNLGQHMVVMHWVEA